MSVLPHIRRLNGLFPHGFYRVKLRYYNNVLLLLLKYIFTYYTNMMNINGKNVIIRMDIKSYLVDFNML